MKKIKEIILTFINGFCMSLADSVPGVSGGTIAFILGFFDKFITALDDLFRGNIEAKKKALIYLIKLGIGWAVGFLLAASILSDLFDIKIYEMSSMFLGFIVFALPLVIKEEKEHIKGKYKNIIFSALGIIFVIGITLLSTNSSLNIDLQNLNIGSAIYIFLVAMIAISAMILPGISGSTLLLIFGIYVPIMNNIKAILHFDFSVLPSLIIFGIGVIVGIVLFSKLLKKCLKDYHSQTTYTILGLMLASIYSITQGPTTLKEPRPAMTFSTFSILFFILGGIIVLGLELLKRIISKKD